MLKTFVLNVAYIAVISIRIGAQVISKLNSFVTKKLVTVEELIEAKIS